MRKSVYDARTERIRNALDGDRRCYKANKIYKGNASEYLYYINTKGFYHILMPGKVRWDNGEIMCYTLDDCRLNPDSTMTMTGQTDFDTIEERMNYVYELLEKADSAC